MGYVSGAGKTRASSKRTCNVKIKGQEVLKVTRSSRELLSTIGSARSMAMAFYTLGMVDERMAQRAAHSMTLNDSKHDH